MTFLLAGFTFAGREIGLWDPVEAPRSDPRAYRVLDGRDSDAASRAIDPLVESRPQPPVSLRLTLLIALVSFALSVVPTRRGRLARRLGDGAASLVTVCSRVPRSFGKATMTLRSRAFVPERRRFHRAFAGTTVRSFLYEFREGAVIERVVGMTLSVVVSVAVGVLVTLYGG